MKTSRPLKTCANTRCPCYQNNKLPDMQRRCTWLCEDYQPAKEVNGKKADKCRFYEVITDPARYGHLPNGKPWCHKSFQECWFPQCLERPDWYEPKNKPVQLTLF